MKKIGIIMGSDSDLPVVGKAIDTLKEFEVPTIRALMMSAAGTVIFPVQDLLGFGADTRINTPGKAEGNWRYRVTEDQLSRVDWEKFAHLNHIYARHAH